MRSSTFPEMGKKSGEPGVASAGFFFWRWDYVMAPRQINIPSAGFFFTIDALFGLVVVWLRRAALLGLLLALIDIMARWYGISLPFSGPGHVELAYLAGVLWLTK